MRLEIQISNFKKKNSTSTNKFYKPKKTHIFKSLEFVESSKFKVYTIHTRCNIGYYNLLAPWKIDQEVYATRDEDFRTDVVRYSRRGDPRFNDDDDDIIRVIIY